MSNVLVDKTKIDLLANAIADKSGEPITMTLDEMVDAVDGIETGGITPTGNIDITQSGVTDVTNYATATVPALSNMLVQDSYQYTGSGGNRKFEVTPEAQNASSDGGWVQEHSYFYGNPLEFNAIPKNTSVTPTESSQTIGGSNVMMEGAVTVNAIPSNYVGSGITQRSSSDLTVSGATVSVPSGYYASNASKEVSNAIIEASNPITTNPTISVSSSGLITASINTEQTISPIDTAGYVNTSRTIRVQASGSATEQLVTKSSSDLTANGATVTAPAGYYASSASKSVSSGSAGTPTATKGTVSNHSVTVTPSVTNTTGYITGGTKTGTAVSVSASELVSGTVNITSSGNTDVTNYATASVASGSATASATKGTVSNHSVTVTPSVTRTAGYITAGSANGTAVTVTAAELASGNKSITENGTNIDVVGYSTVSVDVQGGGTSGVQVGTTSATAMSGTFIVFEVADKPTSFALSAYNGSGSDTVATPSSTNRVVSAVWDGTLSNDSMVVVGQAITNVNNQQVTYLSNGEITAAYVVENGTKTIRLTINANNTMWVDASTAIYNFSYSYGGSASDVHTSNVQVGSGATSITFTGIEDTPSYFSCIFKSYFGTSSGYERVIFVQGTHSTGMVGLEMSSSAYSSAEHWSASYNNGSFTITSQSTNAGGYFHQPGYYQLTYAIESDGGNYQTKSVTYTPTTSTQTETVTADSTYDALKRVNVTVNPIPSEYIIPTGNFAITQNGTGINVAQYATVSVNVSGGTANIGTKTTTNSNDQATTLQFTGMSGQPKAFFLRCTSQLTRSSSYSYYYITAIRYNGTNTNGNYYRRSNGTFYNDTTHYSYSYSGTTLTLSSSASRGAAGGSFYNGNYELVYIY